MCGPDFSACSSLPPYTCVCQSGYTRSGNSCMPSSGELVCPTLKPGENCEKECSDATDCDAGHSCCPYEAGCNLCKIKIDNQPTTTNAPGDTRGVGVARLF
ncbi:perlwapin-like [Dreissena polymorpha]|uniref:perlwapin-like n=1 Tax=Dreissena polymorpha TaxID=45954 RepID=UPI002263FCD4|nr:perlwapin-like [Dreissena polymorpha]